MLKLQPENTIVDIPDLNRFRIGDHVVVDTSADFDRFEGVIIGIELRRVHGSSYLKPSITLLHDGCITDEFKPMDCRKVDPSPPDNRHEFVPNKKFPWFCASCGYAPHEPLKHFQAASLATEGKS